MKRIWIGIGILTVLLALVVGVQTAMRRIHLPIEEDLIRARNAALAGDWEKATAHADRARKRWEDYHELTATVADHSPMDELDTLFAELTVYGRERETPHFAATCSAAAQIAEAMADAHAIKLGNFF